MTKQKIKTDFLEKIVRLVFKKYHWPVSLKISLVFVGTRKMRILNGRYHHKNKVTDVLSFRYSAPVQKLPENYLGEIFICLPQLFKQAKENKFIPKQELIKLLIHSILHLAGCDHQTKRQVENMDRETKKLEAFIAKNFTGEN